MIIKTEACKVEIKAGSYVYACGAGKEDSTDYFKEGGELDSETVAELVVLAEVYSMLVERVKELVR